MTPPTLSLPTLSTARKVGQEERATPGYGSYEAEKRAWLAAHPEATADEVERAFRAIADRLGV